MRTFRTAYAYEAKYVPSRHQMSSVHNGVFRSEALIEIRTLSDEEAPVALKLTTTTRVEYPKDQFGRPIGKPTGPETVTATVDYRHDGEGFYRPVLGPQGEPITLESFDGLMTANAPSEWVGNPFAKLRKAYGSEPGKVAAEILRGLKTREQSEIRAWVSDEMAAGLARTNRIAETLAFIGGALYRRTTEPVWRIGLDHQRQVKLQTRKAFIDHDSFQLRIDGMDMLTAVTSAVGRDLSFKEDAVVEVLRPETLKHDDALAVTRSLAYGVLPHFAEKVGDLKSPGAIRAWGDLREVVDGWDGEDSAQIEAIWEAARAFVGFDMTLRDDRLKNGEPDKRHYYYEPKVSDRLASFVVAKEIMDAGMGLDPDAGALAMIR